MPRDNHSPILYDSLDNNGKCPVCKDTDGASGSRFVTACTAGHLDEVDWDCAVHVGGDDCSRQEKNENPPCKPLGSAQRKCCKPKYYEWEGKGISLSDIKVKCPDCGRTVSMMDIYNLRFACPSRLPENENPSAIKDGAVPFGEPRRAYARCTKEMKTIQRQANSLRIGDTMTFLALPRYSDPIWSKVQRPETYLRIKRVVEQHRAGMYNTTIRDAVASWVDDDVKEHISAQDPELVEFLARFEELENTSSKRTSDFLIEEFEALQQEPNPIKCEVTLPSGSVDMTVLPITEVRTVTVQIGYRRHPYPDKNDAMVPSSVSFANSNDRWFPGFVGVGEGLFLTFKPGFDGASHIRNLKAAADWDIQSDLGSESTQFDLWGGMSKSPMFVWWHTLSHVLLRTLSIRSGYSLASIRERVYVNRDLTRGGILLYTTSPGQDGSMGGLVENAYSIQSVLDAAIESAGECSNDPLCLEIRKSPSRPNGSACHSCMLVSETSCEQRNRGLDRHLLMED